MTSPSPNIIADTVPAELLALTVTREFDAPRAMVFKAWTDPERMAVWWGPKGFTNPVCELDVRPGGAIRIDMQAPDGTVYPCLGTFRDILEPERLSFTTIVPDEQKGGPLFEVLNTAVFTETDGRTTLTLRSQVQQARPGAERYLKGQKEGWRQSLDRLSALLADQSD